MSSDTQRKLRSALERAAWLPEEWIAALRLVADECGARHAQLIGIGGPSMVMFNWISDVGEELASALRDPLLHDPEINYRVLAGITAPECTVVDEKDYALASSKLSGGEYIQFVQQHSIQNGVQTNLRRTQEGLIGLATLRRERTSRHERAQFEQIIPFAYTAVKVQAALGHQGAQLIAGAYETMSKAAFVLDGNGLVQALTPAAEVSLTGPGHFRLNQKKLGLGDPEDDRALQKALQSARLSGVQKFSTHSSLVIGSSSLDPVIVDVIALPEKDWAMPFDPRVVVTLRQQKVGGDRVELLCAAFGFTEVEARVADFLSRGKSRSEIAELRATSDETVKTHIKSIYIKAEVSREIQLAAKVRDLLDGTLND